MKKNINVAIFNLIISFLQTAHAMQHDTAPAPANLPATRAVWQETDLKEMTIISQTKSTESAITHTILMQKFSHEGIAILSNKKTVERIIKTYGSPVSPDQLVAKRDQCIKAALIDKWLRFLGTEHENLSTKQRYELAETEVEKFIARYNAETEDTCCTIC